MKQIFYYILVVFVFLLAGCLSAPQPPGPVTSGAKPQPESAAGEQEREIPEEMEFMGAGVSESLLGSMQDSKADAIRQGVIYIIGEDKEAANRETLDNVLYGSTNQSGFVELIERTRKDSVEGSYVYEGRYMVKLRAVESALKAHGIIGSVTTTEKPLQDPQPIKETVTAADVKLDDVEYEPPTDDEKRFIAKYVDKLSYLVYFNEETGEEAQYMKSAVGMANEYLINNGFNTIDMDTIESLKQDQQLVYEEETGSSMSIIQWIAQKLNADIYIEIYGTTNVVSKIGGKHYGTANVNVKAFDASTGELAAQVAYNLPETGAAFSTRSTEDARTMAIRGVISSKIMERLVTQVKTQMTKILLTGIKYDVIIQNPPNDRIMSKFWQKVKRDIESYKLIYQSEDEVKYSVWIIGNIEELKDAFYDASESIEGLQEMYAILVRGKSITFNSGL